MIFTHMQKYVYTQIYMDECALFFSSPLAVYEVTTFVVSAIVSHHNKLDMVHIQNSTLAGGVAIGTVCNLLVGPHGAVLIGTISAIISVLGYRYLSVSFHFAIHTLFTLDYLAYTQRHSVLCRVFSRFILCSAIVWTGSHCLTRFEYNCMPASVPTCMHSFTCMLVHILFSFIHCAFVGFENSSIPVRSQFNRNISCSSGIRFSFLASAHFQ